MTNTTISIRDDHFCNISGTVDFVSVPYLLEQARALLASMSAPWQIDCCEITYSNSAGLALIFALQRYARQHQQTVTFTNLPNALMAAAKISHVDTILHVM